MLRKLFHAGPTVPERDAIDVAADLRAGEVQLIDVREHDEWRAGHVAGAVHIPLGQLQARMREIDPARPAVVICRSGNRSEHATRFLLSAGYHDVANLAGGILAWARAGLPVSR